MNNNNPDIEKKPEKKKSTLREYIEAILTAVVIAMFIRSFGIEAFKIPSSSMIPTLLIGDHIFVNKFIYGLRIPLTKIKVLEFGKPGRGDVIVFMYPQEEGKDFIKRVIGLPGDIVKVDDMDIFVNGERILTKNLVIEQSDEKGKLRVSGSDEYAKIPVFTSWQRYRFYEERIGKNNFIVQYHNDALHQDGTFEVPEGHYFVMGDNRDNSSDSREWGFVPVENVKGKAMFIWLSLNKDNGGIRLSRIGTWIR